MKIRRVPVGKSGAAAFLLTLIAGVALAAGSRNPVPLVYQPLAPISAMPGAGAFTLTVNGFGFVTGSVVNWNGAARSTTLVSASQLTAQIFAADVASAGTATVTVVSPAPGGGVSNPVYFPVAVARTQLTFPESTLTAGQGPAAVVTADFNGDGKLDLAASNELSDDVSIFLGNGDGTFQAGQTYAVGSVPFRMASGDLNGDGKVDLVITNQNSRNLSVLLGNGDGTFQVGATLDVGNGPLYIALADLNNDGKLDVVATNFRDNTISVLIGNGDGTFQPQVTYPTGVEPRGIAAGDFSRDGKIDLAVVNGCGNDPQCQSPGTVSVLLGNGDGTFQSRKDYDLGTGPQSIAEADLNGDGILDLAATNFTDGTISTLLGNGDGTFQPQVTHTGGIEVNDIGVADINGDGKLDIVSLSESGGINLLLGSGNQTFQYLFFQDSAAIGLAIGDFNGDGELDIASTSGSAVEVLLQGNGAILSISPASLTFPATDVGMSSAAQMVTLTNTGAGVLNISGITVSGTDPGDFSQTNTCSLPINPGASCAVSATFSPTLNGPRSASLTITDNAGGSPQSVPLSGTGLGPAATLAPNSIKFGDELVLKITSPPVNTTITNTGALNLNISSITVTGDSGDFPFVNTCPAILSPGQKCTVRVAFKPASVGAKNGVLTFTDNAPNSPQTITLSGSGTLVTLSPTQLLFGNVPVGMTSSPQTVTLTSHSTQTLNIFRVKVTGTTGSGFAQTNTCGSSIPPKGTCTISVTFTPASKGQKAGTLSVSDSGGGSPQTIPLFGNGT